MHDIAVAFRQFRKSPGFAITVVLTIALGIGANTAIFTLVHAILMKSLPVIPTIAASMAGFRTITVTSISSRSISTNSFSRRRRSLTSWPRCSRAATS